MDFEEYKNESYKHYFELREVLGSYANAIDRFHEELYPILLDSNDNNSDLGHKAKVLSSCMTIGTEAKDNLVKLTAYFKKVEKLQLKINPGNFE